MSVTGELCELLFNTNHWRNGRQSNNLAGVRLTAWSATKTTVKVLTSQHKLDSFVNVNSVQSILQNHTTQQ